MTAFIRRPFVKASCFFLSVVLTIITILGIIGFAFCSTQSFYVAGNPNFGESEMAQMIVSASDYTVGDIYIAGGETKLRQTYNPQYTNLRVRITDEEGNVYTNYDPEEETPAGMEPRYYYYLTDNETGVRVASTIYDFPWEADWSGFDMRMYTSHSAVMELGVASPMEARDVLYFAGELYYFLYRLRFPLIFISIAGVILTVFVHAALFAGCGRKPGSEEVFPGWQERIPFDLYILLFGFVWLLLLGMALEMAGLVSGYATGDVLFCMFLELLSILGLVLVSEMILCSCAVRFKTRKWWRNSLIWKFCAWCGRFISRFFSGTFRSAGRMVGSLPLTWQGLAITVGILFGEFFFTILVYGNGSFLSFVFWLVYNIAVVLAAIVVVAQMRRLQDAAGRMAKGELDYQVDTAGMLGPFKGHAEDLNAIRDGLSHALDQKMRSERMKTELITNVSHDIKTPLTSIVNYVDLLSKEKPENERMKSYIEALQRQSSRLRKLIEDLVEASKASTGNLSVDLQPCELGVLLEQAAGEYQERMEQKGLELVASAPQEPVMVLADSRRIWRVLDNLLGNITKYALSGTRVYVDLEKREGEAMLTLRNISRDRLKVSPDELMERFVRGDASRSTEGSGLGLSIAKSLMELQHGRLELSIDGDLFKATVRMPLLQAAPGAEPVSEPAAEPDIGYTPGLSGGTGEIPVPTLTVQPSIPSPQPDGNPFQQPQAPVYSGNTAAPWRTPVRPAPQPRDPGKDPLVRIGEAAGKVRRLFGTGKKK